MEDLYTEIILDHYKNPRNKGEIPNASIAITEHNPSCGDKIQIDLLIEDNKIADLKFSGVGCAISQAAISMLSEEIIGKPLAEVKEISNEQIYDMLKVPISPGRVKCALLGLAGIKKAIITYNLQNNG